MGDHIWPREEGDYMEIGDTGWVPIKGGAFYNRYTEQTMDADGRIFDRFGELEYDPTEEDQ